MSQEAKDFIDDWVRENINAEGYAAYSNDIRVLEVARQCRSDAQEVGISDHALDAAIAQMWRGEGGFTAFVKNAMDAATDEEVRRLADKDD